MSTFWIEGGQTMLFIGDSITDCGRRGAEMPLGSGYVRLFTELATARFPDRNIAYINKGIGGNKVSDLVESDLRVIPKTRGLLKLLFEMSLRKPCC